MTFCVRPIDPIDAEALAVGSEPVLASDASEHARACAFCGEKVAVASKMADSLDRALKVDIPDLAGRIMRLRPFSRRERRDFRLWRGACGLAAGTSLTGLLLLILPGLTVREQAGLELAAFAPVAMLWRAIGQALAQTIGAAPSGLAALSQALRTEPWLGLVALLVLAPTLFGLRRALARVRR